MSVITVLYGFGAVRDADAAPRADESPGAAVGDPARGAGVVAGRERLQPAIASAVSTKAAEREHCIICINL
ncbi:MAG: hypothetical protein ABIR59_04085 [Gemmatimonadales bacterium]